MSVLHCRSVVAAIIAVVIGAGTAGCGDALTGGAVSKSSYPPVSPLTSPERGSVVLPAGFPADVPVLAGRYRRISSSLAGASDSAYLLAVSEVGSGALARAQRKLVDAGFVNQEFIGQPTYIGPRHTVTIASADDGFGPYLIYTVVELTGMPALPSFDLSDLLGG
ncbi:hypothetical protein GOEFS_035_00320 [Gordonia effusa NBRC 100432]|uniref:Lipoprotein n=1 Tax=Gordonia effusa NBRC 100432 TaxID=1077974 RepID=H0QXE9_9ACTN|nr:hypothetical protein [Gordonia effusa]GAB17500.1 hypothetical protein GOEFS_035_00320 [Gordonia effusa NBRC 100432]